MRVAVLGPVAAERDGTAIDLGVRKQRALLAALAMTPDRAVSTSTLIELLWPTSPPPAALQTLQTYVAGLRRALEPGRAARSASELVVTAETGYALRVQPETIDAVRFERAIATARRCLGAAATDALAEPGPDRASARAALDEARALWRGTPYAELGSAPAAEAERLRLAELRLIAEELVAAVRLADGDAAALAADLEALIAQQPLRERLWALRAVALARAGRQSDALAALRDIRTLLADELGVDPSVELRRVEEAILRQDPALTAAPTEGPRQLPPAPPAPAPPPAPWPLVGRAAELRRLTELLDQASAGRPVFAALVGEPGIGKSRLAAELARAAAGRGAEVRVGRCSQDQGAPPLWPWTAVLAGLPEIDIPQPAIPAEEPTDPEAERFRTWSSICSRVLARAADRTLVLVLDDLHWADTSSLRVLRHLVTTAETGRLFVLCTWRRHPEPTGPLAQLAEALARRHGTRVDLTGLTSREAGELVTAVAGPPAGHQDPELLIRRSEGNPFFLVEYARLLQDGATPRVDAVPAAVSDVLSQRLAGQPEETMTALRAAAVLGRDVDLGLLAAVLGQDDEAVLDALDTAVAGGLLIEDGVDRFRFSHALIRDAVAATLPMSRAARLHARAARVCAARTPRAVGRIARHWLAAGPAHAAEAWRAAAVAADAAMAVYAHEEARDLLHAALEAQHQDAAASWEERYDVLMALAEACRLAADWERLQSATDEAVAVAEAAGDVRRAARAAVGTTSGAVWMPRTYGTVHPPAVAALRRAQDRLPPGDGELRCRVMLALAGELYYTAAAEEREALTEEAVAMARRLADPRLLLEALASSFIFTWRPSTMEDRLARALEFGDRAQDAGDLRAQATAATLRAISLLELGRMEEFDAALTAAQRVAEQLRMLYLLLVLDAMEAPWLAMQGRSEDAELVLQRALERIGRSSLPQVREGAMGALLTVRLFQGRLAEELPRLRELAGWTDMPVTATLVAMLLRLGRREEAEGALVVLPPIDVAREDWFSMMNWGAAAEVALGLGLPELGAKAYVRLSPHAGRMCSGGSGAPQGPVHLFLAFAAAAAGETATATRHAELGLAQCRQWQIPPVEKWFRDQRDLHGF